MPAPSNDVLWVLGVAGCVDEVAGAQAERGAVREHLVEAAMRVAGLLDQLVLRVEDASVLAVDLPDEVGSDVDRLAVVEMRSVLIVEDSSVGDQGSAQSCGLPFFEGAVEVEEEPAGGYVADRLVEAMPSQDDAGEPEPAGNGR